MPTSQRSRDNQCEACFIRGVFWRIAEICLRIVYRFIQGKEKYQGTIRRISGAKARLIPFSEAIRLKPYPDTNLLPSSALALIRKVIPESFVSGQRLQACRNSQSNDLPLGAGEQRLKPPILLPGDMAEAIS